MSFGKATVHFPCRGLCTRQAVPINAKNSVAYGVGGDWIVITRRRDLRGLLSHLHMRVKIAGRDH
jgi:hypothetical protein